MAVTGIADPGYLRWLDPPHAGGFAEARSLLAHLGAVAKDGIVTPHGRALSRLSLHPRLAHMVLKGLELGAGEEVCQLGALLGERDVLRRHEGVPEADIRSRLDLLRGTTIRAGVDREALRRARLEVKRCREQSRMAVTAGSVVGPSTGVLVALAYSDRVARRRLGKGGRYLLRNGLGVTLDPQPLSSEERLAVAEVEGRTRDGRILLAAPLALNAVERAFAAEIARGVGGVERGSRWCHGLGSRAAGAIVLRGGSRATPGARVGDGRPSRGYQDQGDPGPPVGAQRAADTRPRRLDELDGGDLADAPRTWLGPAPVRSMEVLAPSHLAVPSGSRIRVDYRDPGGPVLAVRLQEVFDWKASPRVGGGRVPVTLHLLSPAGRPVPVTRDLAGFWQRTYFEVRKDLRGRYPRHTWPDDPMAAEPTRRAKPTGGAGNREQ